MLTGVIALLALGGVLVSVSTWFNGRSAAWEAYDRLLVGAANDISESIRILDGAPIADLPVSAFQLLGQAPDDRISYAVRGPRGELITGFDEAPGRRDARATGPVYFDAPMQDEPARFVEITRRFAEREFSGVVSITVGQTLRARRAMALELMLDALVPMAVAGAALILIAIGVVRGAVRPLGEIAEGLSRRDPYDLTPVPTETVPREINVILKAMNGFMGRLDRQFGVMQNLISDTAHQLRTPVAAIRVQAESAMDEDDPAERARMLDRLLGRTRSLGTLLDQMLSRALVIHRTDSMARAVLDVRMVALEIVETRDHEVLAPGVEVELVIGEDPVMVEADEFSLVQAGKNLLSNALTHGRPPVRIGVETAEGRACLWVEDAGPGMSPDLAATLGQRFLRAAAPRADSAGIGLSIVAAVADSLGGEVALSQRPGGFRVTLALPLHRAADRSAA